MKRELGVENTGSGYWTFQDRYVGDIPHNPVHRLLAWILQQLNLGHYRVENESGREVDEEVAGVSIILGRAVPFAGLPEEAATEAAWERVFAVWAAEKFAGARERAYAPGQRDVIQGWITATANSGADKLHARMNTEFHYAFEFVERLGKLTRRSLELSPSAFEGKASADTLEYLREASRCHILRLPRAAIALCRACLEQALRESISAQELKDERQWDSVGVGELELLIRAALRLKRLDRSLAGPAHEVQRRGNEVMHRRPIDTEQSEDTLRLTKRILEDLYGF